jgi:hypothetical protein
MMKSDFRVLGIAVYNLALGSKSGHVPEAQERFYIMHVDKKESI